MANPGLQSNDTEKRAGLEPEEFQRRLIAVTAIVLVLGVVGGTCLGMKIEKAERLQQSNAAQPSGGAAPATSEESR